MLDFLGTNWLALALLLAAGVLAVLRRFGGAAAVGCLGLGGLLLAKFSPTVLGYTFDVSNVLVGVALFGLAVTGGVLLVFRGWSFRLGVVLGSVLLLGLGGWVVRPAGAGLWEGVKLLRGLEFVRPVWLLLLQFVPFIIGISRRSLSGLGPTRKWLAISARALGVAFLAMALAEPRFRRPSEHVTVLYVVDRSFSVPQDLDPDRPADDPRDLRWQRVRYFIEESVKRRGADHVSDQSGLIFFGRRPKLVLPPAAVVGMPVDERLAGPIDGNYTDIAAALKLAVASFPEGTAKRVVLISDGNENLGSAEEQANLAKQNGVQIDAVALAPGYRNESEVLVESVQAPPTTAQGQRLPVRVLVRNATPDRIVEGRLEVVKVTRGRSIPIEIEPGPQVRDLGPPPRVRLLPGQNPFRFRDLIDPKGEEDAAFAYRATFVPLESWPDGRPGVPVAGLPGDRAANNRAAAAVVSRGQRRVLFLEDVVGGKSPHEHLVRILRNEGMKLDVLPADKLPNDRDFLPAFLGNYDAVVLANVPYERFGQNQAEVLRASVFDQGVGLVMIGGPDSFGPGGYQETPIEAALPVDCEIKALKAAGKGGLVLVMHASEMADGNKWQKEIAKLAIQRLGPADMVGVVDFGAFGGNPVNWHIPFQQIGDNKAGLVAKVDSMSPGDMPDFDPFLKAAADTLADPKHDLAVRHCILISDGDPNYTAQGAGGAAVKKMADNNITCTTVGVATHGGAEKTRLKAIAEATKDGSGKPGNFYDVTDPSQLPAIYIKESRRVSQSFVYDKPFDPRLRLPTGPAEGLPGKLPQLRGFVRTTKKENILAEMEIEGPSPYPDQKFPVLASWRYGLGKAVAFTSDARTQPGSPLKFWDQEWAESDIYRNFWKQVLNWVMREAERGKLVLVSEYRDGRVRVTADVRDDQDRPVSGVSLRGAVTPPRPPGPGEKAPEVEFKPKGAGRYEAEFPAEEAGSYFVTVHAQEPERDKDGRIARNPDGTPRMATADAARCGVTVPYSPEFADLESNAPLLKRLAEQTDGEFHTEDEIAPDKVGQWGWVFRNAKEATRALLPFWFWLVFAAAFLLLFDVAVRRIALEWGEVKLMAARTWGRLRRQTVVEDETEGLGRLLRRKAAAGETIDRSRAQRRFEPGTGPVEGPPLGADEYAARTPTGPTPTAPPSAGDRTAPPPPQEEDTFEKLRQAKLRAKRQQNRDDNPPR